eukprot:Sro835_g208850.2  (648) ;mRNA; r:23933-25876
MDADTFLKEALNNVGKRLSRPSLTSMKKDVPPKADDEKVATTATITTTAATTTAKPAVKDSDRMKSSAKVSTAVLKFQQALALSKSATKAAKTQQDTQNKLLGEVHKDKTKPDDFVKRASLLKATEAKSAPTGSSNSNAVAVSPVSTVDVVDPTADGANESPKVPSDLDGDSDIDSEIEIDDVDEDDDPVSDVETDSEDEDDNNKTPTPVVAPMIPLVSVTDDTSDDSDVDEHSDVELDSDDDLDSDDEFATGDTARATTNVGSDNGSESGKDDAMDSDDDIDSDNDAKSPKPETNLPVSQEAVVTPLQSSVVAATISALEKESEADEASDAAGSEDRRMEEISHRLHLVRSMSCNNADSLNGFQEKSLSDLQSITGRSAGPNLGIPGLSPGSKASLGTEEDSQGISYLPMAMKKPKSDPFADLKGDSSHDTEDSGSDMEIVSTSDSEANRPSRKSLTRKHSTRRRSASRSRSNADSVDSGRKSRGDEKSRSRTRSTSRARRAPSRSRSSTMARPSDAEGGGSHRERRSKPQISSSSADKTRPTDRTKTKEKASGRSSSASRSRTLAGLSTLTTTPSNSKPSSGEGSSREEGRKGSSRRRMPSRAKSHDVDLRKPSRSGTSRSGDREVRERRSRKPAGIEASHSAED